MELYIEKEFLDNFNIEFKEEIASKSQLILATILKEYPEIVWFTDHIFDSVEELELIKQDNTFFKAMLVNSTNHKQILSFDEANFNSCKFEQALIFTQEEKEWFDKAKQKGALCFCYDDYEEKINTIINDCNAIKIDLFDVFAGWDSFSILNEIPKNKIVINDGYLFWEDGNNKPIDQNVAPLLKKITNKKTKISIEVFTNYLNPDPKTKKRIELDKIKDKLNNIFRDYDIRFEFIQHHEHDRIVYSNFFILECGKGFNFNINKRNNSKITVETIFDKFNYKRINNHLRLLKKKKNESVVS